MATSSRPPADRRVWLRGGRSKLGGWALWKMIAREDTNPWFRTFNRDPALTGRRKCWHPVRTFDGPAPGTYSTRREGTMRARHLVPVLMLLAACPTRTA